MTFLLYTTFMQENLTHPDSLHLLHPWMPHLHFSKCLLFILSHLFSFLSIMLISKSLCSSVHTTTTITTHTQPKMTNVKSCNDSNYLQMLCLHFLKENHNDW